MTQGGSTNSKGRDEPPMLFQNEPLMSNSPTPSAPTNQLIALATAVSQGQAPPESYQELLQQRLLQSQENRQVFEERAQLRGEAFLATHGHLLDSVLDHMEAYENGLLKQAEFFESGEVDALLQGNEMLADAIVPLLEALDLYGGAFLAFGPSEHAVMNSVINSLTGIVQGTASPQTLEEIQRTAVEYHEKAIAEIDASDHGKSEGYQQKRKAYEDMNRALRELAPVKTVEEIEDMVRPLQLALEAKVHAEERIFAENTALKPTSMPSANVLINTCKGVMDEVIPADTLVEALRWYRAFTEELEDQFDLAMEGETNSLVILEELPKTREIIDLHDELLDRFEEAMEEMDRQVMDGILEEFVDVIERLEASSEVFMEAAEREGKLVCVKCGHANPPANRLCESCSFKLPQMVDPTMFSQSTFELEERSGLDGVTDDDYHMGVKTYALFEACYNFHEGHIDEAAFREHIETSRRTVERSEDGVSNLSRRELTAKQEEMMTPEQLQTFQDSQEMFLETRHLLEEGIDEWLEGLELFEHYIETRHRPTLESGIQLIFVASQKIHKVAKLGEIAEKTLQELEDSDLLETEGQVSQEESEPEQDHVVNIEESYDQGTF